MSARAQILRQMAIAHHRTGRAHRPRALPLASHPKAIEAEYARDIIALVLPPLRSALAPLLAALPGLVASARAESRRQDAGEGARARQLLGDAAERLRTAVKPVKVEALAREFASHVSTYQRIQLGAQVKAAFGVDVNPGADKKVAAQIDGFVHHNVHLITTVPERLLDRVEGRVHRALTAGDLSEDVADDLRDAIGDELGVSERHLRFIARDQAGKLHGQIAKARHQALGVKRFVWRTSEDERVRGDPDGLYPRAEPSHYELNGHTFRYADPPQPDGADDPLTPGSDYQCRCTGEPVLDDVLGDDGDEDDSGDREPDDDQVGTSDDVPEESEDTDDAADDDDVSDDDDDDASSDDE